MLRLNEVNRGAVRALDRRDNTTPPATANTMTPPEVRPRKLPNGLEIQPTTLDHLRRFAEGGYLYAILDACDAPAVPEKAKELGEASAVSLFKGTAQEDYWAVAPYLFRVSPETLAWIVATVWNEPWGVFVMSKAAIDDLRAHCRRFLVVAMPRGEQSFFRYYDPRVLKGYLPTCVESELGRFFGPVRGFCIPDQKSEKAWLAQYAKAGAPDAADSSATPLWQIRQEQIDALQEASVREAQDRIASALRVLFPEQTARIPEQHLAAFCRRCIERAAAYAMTKEGSVYVFTAASLMYGEGFDAAAAATWTREIFPQPNITEEVKTELLRMRLSFDGVEV